MWVKDGEAAIAPKRLVVMLEVRFSFGKQLAKSATFIFSDLVVFSRKLIYTPFWWKDFLV